MVPISSLIHSLTASNSLRNQWISASLKHEAFALTIWKNVLHWSWLQRYLSENNRPIRTESKEFWVFFAYLLATMFKISMIFWWRLYLMDLLQNYKVFMSISCFLFRTEAICRVYLQLPPEEGFGGNFPREQWP